MLLGVSFGVSGVDRSDSFLPDFFTVEACGVSCRSVSRARDFWAFFAGSPDPKVMLERQVAVHCRFEAIARSFGGCWPSPAAFPASSTVASATTGDVLFQLSKRADTLAFSEEGEDNRPYFPGQDPVSIRSNASMLICP